VTSRALALLTILASPVFVVAAVAGWLTELWPANPTTLVIAAFAVVSGPVLGMVHVATAQENARATGARSGSGPSAHAARRRCPRLPQLA
jgi:hypothetical protein